jgi:hypothetical protein
MEHRKCIEMGVRYKRGRRLVRRDLQGTGVLRASGFVGTGFRAGLARMRRDTADAERCGQEQCPDGNYKSEESCHC